MRRIKLTTNKQEELLFLRPYFDEGDNAIWARLMDHQVDNQGSHCMRVGDGCVYDIPGVGKAVATWGEGSVVLHVHHPISHNELCGILGIPELPDCEPHDPLRDAPRSAPQIAMRCPFCGTEKLSLVNDITTVVTGNEQDPSDVSNSLDLEEYQCRGACEGRSFWIGS